MTTVLKTGRGVIAQKGERSMSCSPPYGGSIGIILSQYENGNSLGPNPQNWHRANVGRGERSRSLSETSVSDVSSARSREKGLSRIPIAFALLRGIIKKHSQENDGSCRQSTRTGHGNQGNEAQTLDPNVTKEPESHK